jgi:vitamin B12 transporter
MISLTNVHRLMVKDYGVKKYVIVVMFFVHFLAAQDTITYQIPQVIVESSKFSLSPLDMNRSTTIIDSASLQAAAPQSIDEALQLFSTTELRRRGAMGIQTDIGIRGSTFSQQAILLNGIRINDPQTAHHNFDIPVAMSSIKQIEIVRGPSSSHFGPDAFGGIVNIVTSQESPAASIELSGGQLGYAEGAGTYGFSQNQWRSTSTLQYQKSDGYRYDTEFESMTASTSNSLVLPDASLHLLIGYVNKDFGAYDFYSPGANIPSHEKTETIFTGFGSEFSFNRWDISSHVTYRHHFDDFIFMITDPSYSHNKHNTNVYIADLNALRDLSSSVTLLTSLEASTDNINSTNLGIHSRKFAALSEIVRWKPAVSISFDGGFRVDAHSEYGNLIHPIMNAGYFIDQENKLYVSYGTSFRAPSYTDLYYSDPYTTGNPNLKPEKGTSYEAGYLFFPANTFQTSAAFFYREQENLIDYVQYFNGDLYHAENFDKAVLRGTEIQTRWQNQQSSLLLKHISLGYTFIESELNTPAIFNSRYSLTHPKHQLNGAATVEIPLDVMITFGGSFAHRSNYRDQTSIDLTMTKRIDMIEVVVKATNLFNESYQEIPGIPLPGRWITGKIRWNIF